MSQGPNNEGIPPDPLGPDLEGEWEEPELTPEGEPFGEVGETDPGWMEGDAPPEAEASAHPEEPFEEAPVGADDLGEDAELSPAVGQSAETDTDDDFTRSAPGPGGAVAAQQEPRGPSSVSRLLTALTRALSLTDAYTWLLGISVLAITLGVLLLFVELKRYDFKIKATRVESSESLQD